MVGTFLLPIPLYIVPCLQLRISSGFVLEYRTLNSCAEISKELSFVPGSFGLWIYYFLFSNPYLSKPLELWNIPGAGSCSPVLCVHLGKYCLSPSSPSLKPLPEYSGSQVTPVLWKYRLRDKESGVQEILSK